MADAYIGYRSAGRRPEQYNDRIASANAPLSAVRGYLAGTAGLPGDLEGLARAGMSQVPLELLRALPGARMFGLGARADQTPSMPTSEFYNEYLPKPELNQTPTGKLFTGAGNLMGGAYSTNLARAGIKGTEGLAAMAERVLAEAPRSGSRAAQKGVIKMKGGNWLAGSVEDSLKPLKTNEDLVRIARENGVLIDETALSSAQNLNNWVDKTLTKYVKNEMGTAEDPVRALAEKGVLHYEPQRYPADTLVANTKRVESGFPEWGMGESDLARDYETMADLMIQPTEARNILGNYQGMGPLRKSRDGELFLQNNPGLLKVPPETLFNDIAQSGLAQDLGFDHLIDELRNATNPASGLPANLLLKPEALSRVTVPQAVERVAKINAWREAQKVEANQALANNAATQLVKEYPEQGYKWVELKAPEMQEGWVPPERYEIRKPTPSAESLAIFDKEKGQYVTSGLASEEQAIKHLYQMNTKQSLEDALKYEGDTMGHCVGGYCPDVLEGRSRIYSLRDAKGQPHVTVEVKPNKHLEYNDWFQKQSEEMQNRIAQRRVEDKNYDISETPEYLADRAAQPPRIVQIKGKGNKKPNDEYLPFVQDFVKGGQWSDVGDLGNTGLIDIQDPNAVLRALGNVSPERNINQAIQNFNAAAETAPNAQRYMSIDEMRDFLGGAKPEGFAEGGHVAYDPDRVDRIVQGFDKGGPVRAGDGLPDPSLINLPLYARTVSEEMFPDERDNPKRDAARHMLAAAIAAQKTSPGIAEFLGKAYEFKEAPLRTTGYFLGLSEPRSDYHTDLHNNAIGVQLGKDNRTLRAMLDAVERETNRGTPKTQPGRASLRPDAVSKYAKGGSVTAYDPSRVDAIVNEFM